LPFCDVTLAARKPQNSAYPEKLLTLGDHLRKKRLDLGLYQKDVAVAIGVDTTTIYNWENNRTSPPVRFIHRVVEFLGHGPPDLKSVSLGERIKRYRYLKGITQKELARQIGIDPTTLRRLEGNQGRCLESVRRKVANLLGRGIPSSQSKRRHL
jgi:transcriptional regulator with XRE-family HTH domain